METGAWLRELVTVRQHLHDLISPGLYLRYRLFLVDGNGDPITDFNDRENGLLEEEAFMKTTFDALIPCIYKGIDAERQVTERYWFDVPLSEELRTTAYFTSNVFGSVDWPDERPTHQARMRIDWFAGEPLPDTKASSLTRPVDGFLWESTLMGLLRNAPESLGEALGPIRSCEWFQLVLFHMAAMGAHPMLITESNTTDHDAVALLSPPLVKAVEFALDAFRSIVETEPVTSAGRPSDEAEESPGRRCPSAATGKREAAMTPDFKEALSGLLRAVERHRLQFLCFASPSRMSQIRGWEVFDRGEDPLEKIPPEELDEDGVFLFRYRGMIDTYAHEVLGQFGHGEGRRLKELEGEREYGDLPTWGLDSDVCRFMQETSDKVLAALEAAQACGPPEGFQPLWEKTAGILHDGDQPWYSATLVRWVYLSELDQTIVALKKAQVGIVEEKTDSPEGQESGAAAGVAAEAMADSSDRPPAIDQLQEAHKKILLAHQEAEAKGQKPPSWRKIGKMLGVSHEQARRYGEDIEKLLGAPLPGRDKDKARRESSVPPEDLDKRAD